ncbi:MAG: HD domain-containing protein [Rhodocyclaceae bacterium]|nr:HD domain-containing protein [Rhodocyclaceae bacterium]
MDIDTIIPPTVEDEEALQTFFDALVDHVLTIERDVSRLKDVPGDREAIASLFRAMHNIKGDAAMCKVDFAVAIAHPIEGLLSRLRAGEVVFSDLTAEAVLLATDRLELATDSLLSHHPLDNLRLPQLVQGLERMSRSMPEGIDTAASALIESVTGFKAAASTILPAGKSLATSRKNLQVADDLRFFRAIALQSEARSPMFKGRTNRILRLALETNQIGGKKLDPVQLEAAVYLHDLGMMLLPEPLWLHVGRMNNEEKMVLHSHPGYAAGLVQRMEGWEDAARMIAQHHEMPDGSGYPAGLKGDDICDGAKLLAIVDAFEAIILKHIHRGRNRSVLRAIAEINACDKQFAPEWIEPFNRVIRRTIES